MNSFVAYIVISTISLISTRFYAKKTCEKRIHMFFTCINGACVINTITQNYELQIILHDCYASLVTYACLSCGCKYLTLHLKSLLIIQLVTRGYYDKCIFLWKNESRNTLADIIIVFLLIGGNHTRKRFSYIRRYKFTIPIVVGVMSHHFPDHRQGWKID